MTLSDALGKEQAPQSELEAAQRQVARLTRRLERERKAREEAEGIADRGMRELWMTNQELDQRVAEQTEDVKAAYDLLERSFSAATRFVSNLSHEMLTPLNGVTGMLELIEQHSHTDTLATYVGTARESTDRLHLLVRRLLDLVQLSAGMLSASPHDFSSIDLVHAIEQRWRVRCLQSQKLLTVSSSIEPDRLLRADFDRLLQIIDEVLDNARLHADPGVLTVTISLDPETSQTETPEIETPEIETLRISISDAGPGFVPPDTSSLFDAILHVDTAPGRATEGAGIGLALAKELSRALGGSLSITSEPGAATTVMFRVPV